MRFIWVFFAAILAEGVLLAFEVWLGAMYGNPISWASAAFISVMAGVTIAAYAKS